MHCTAAGIQNRTKVRKHPLKVIQIPRTSPSLEFELIQPMEHKKIVIINHHIIISFQVKFSISFN